MAASPVFLIYIKYISSKDATFPSPLNWTDYAEDRPPQRSACWSCSMQIPIQRGSCLAWWWMTCSARADTTVCTFDENAACRCCPRLCTSPEWTQRVHFCQSKSKAQTFRQARVLSQARAFLCSIPWRPYMAFSRFQWFPWHDEETTRKRRLISYDLFLLHTNSLSWIRNHDEQKSFARRGYS